MVRSITYGVVSALLVMLAPLGAQSQESEAQQTFRSAIDVVSIQATVRDSRGRMVRGLTAADFEVLDNGQRRPIIELRSDQESPLSVAILVDMSGSMRMSAKIDMVRQAYDSVLVQLASGRDEAGRVYFRLVASRADWIHQRHQDPENSAGGFSAVRIDVTV